MGLELTVVRTKKGLDLGKVCALKEALEEGWDWTTHGFTLEPKDRHAHLMLFADAIGQNDIHRNAKIPQKTATIFKDMPKDEFEMYKGILVNSISPFNESDSHMYFDWDRIVPNKDELVFSCMGELHTILMECEKDGYKRLCGDYIVELDQKKVKTLAKRWKGQAFKIWLSKWVGYFNPEAEARMIEDVAKELGLDRRWAIEPSDMKHMKECILELARKMKASDRIWLMSSY